MNAKLKTFSQKKVLSITTILLLINVFVYILQLTIPSLFTNLSLKAGLVFSRPWTIFTSMFMHSTTSLSHILFNMYALLIFGSLIEQRIGRKNFLYSYLASGVAAAIAFEIYHRAIGTLNVSAVGASGAIMGILGLTIMLLPKMRVAFFFIIPMSMRTAGIIFALIDLVGLINPNSGISHIAHLGGLLVGLIIGQYFVKKQKEFQQNFKIHIVSKPKEKASNPRDYNKTIELTKDDVDSYFKYGKL